MINVDAVLLLRYDKTDSTVELRQIAQAPTCQPSKEWGIQDPSLISIMLPSKPCVQSLWERRLFLKSYHLRLSYISHTEFISVYCDYPHAAPNSCLFTIFLFPVFINSLRDDDWTWFRGGSYAKYAIRTKCNINTWNMCFVALPCR